MSNLFLALFFVAILALIVGLISPKLVVRWGAEEKRTRGRVALTYGIAIVVLFFAFGIASDHEKGATSPSQTVAAANPPSEVSKPATVPAPVLTTAQNPAPTTTAPSQATKVQPWRQLTKDQQYDVQILNADLGAIINDAQNHDLADFAVDLKGQEQDVADAEKDIAGRPLSSKDSFQNVFTLPANASPSDYQISPIQLFRTLVYSMRSVDSDLANPSAGSGSYLNDLGTDVENVRDDAADAQQSFVVLGYPS